MLHIVSELKDSVAAMLSGIDLSNVDSLNACFERATSVLMQNADIPEASITQNLTLYAGVYDYLCDTRIFGTAAIDLQPQGVTRWAGDFVFKRPQEMFDRTKAYFWDGTMITFRFSNGQPIIRVKSNLPQAQVVLDPMTTIGNWVTSGSASGLTQDTAVYYQSPASIRFTLTGASTGYLTETLNNSVDLSSYQNVGVVFLAIRIPDGATATNLTSITLKLGSSASNYVSVTKTSGFLGSWVAGEWLLVSFDLSNVTTTGSPSWTQINYIQLGFIHAGTFTNFRVGGLWIAQPCPVQVIALSDAIFLPSGGSATLTRITADTDTIILNDAAYLLYQYESAIAILEQVGGGASDSTKADFTAKLHGTLRRSKGGGYTTSGGLYEKYQGDNPSEELRQSGSWYETSGHTNNNG